MYEEKKKKRVIKKYLEGALVILNKDDLGELSEDNVEAVGNIVHTAVKTIGLHV
jgi:hypothetical protein